MPETASLASRRAHSVRFSSVAESVLDLLLQVEIAD